MKKGASADKAVGMKMMGDEGYHLALRTCQVLPKQLCQTAKELGQIWSQSESKQQPFSQNSYLSSPISSARRRQRSLSGCYVTCAGYSVSQGISRKSGSYSYCPTISCRKSIGPAIASAQSLYMRMRLVLRKLVMRQRLGRRGMLAKKHMPCSQRCRPLLSTVMASLYLRNFWKTGRSRLTPASFQNPPSLCSSSCLRMSVTTASLLQGLRWLNCSSVCMRSQVSGNRCLVMSSLRQSLTWKSGCIFCVFLKKQSLAAGSLPPSHTWWITLGISYGPERRSTEVNGSPLLKARSLVNGTLNLSEWKVMSYILENQSRARVRSSWLRSTVSRVATRRKAVREMTVRALGMLN